MDWRQVRNDIYQQIRNKSLKDIKPGYGAPRESLPAVYSGGEAEKIFTQLLAITNPPIKPPNPDVGCGRGYWNDALTLPSYEHIIKEENGQLSFCGEWENVNMFFNTKKGRLVIKLNDKSPTPSSRKLLCKECNTIYINIQQADNMTQMGVNSIKVANHQIALEQLNAADILRPNSAWTLQNRGVAKQLIGDYKGALEDLNQADSLSPNDAFTLQNRGESKRLLGDYKGALEDMNKADELTSNNIFSLRSRGATKRTLGDYKGALEDLNKADELSSNDAFTLKNRGDVRRQLGDYKGALKDLNKADSLHFNDSYTLKIRGTTKRLLGDYKGALKDLSKADSITPNDAHTLQSRGIARQKLGDYKGALEDLNKAHVLCPDDAFTLKVKGETKRLLGDYKGALEDLNKADELSSNDAFTLRSRGATKCALFDYNGAMKDLTLSNKLVPNLAFCLEWMAKAEANIDAKEPPVKIESDFEMKRNDEFDSSSLESALNVDTFHAEKRLSTSGFSIPTEIFLQDLEQHEKLGEGAFGEVHRGEWKGIKVAVKKIRGLNFNNVKQIDNVMHEAKILQQLRHQAIVLCYGSCENKVAGHVLIVTEFMEGGDLHSLLHVDCKKLQQEDIKNIALDIALGLVYLHSQKPMTVHRDLKSPNVLLDRSKKSAKIADFGLAKTKGTLSHLSTVAGTFNWMAPEVMNDAKYTEKADVYSFGMILYELTTNKIPFHGLNQAQMIRKVCDKQERPPLDECPKLWRKIILFSIHFHKFSVFIFDSRVVLRDKRALNELHRNGRLAGITGAR